MPKKEISLDDFISEEIEIKTYVAIDPNEKLSRFANIKIPAIDPTISRDILKIAENIKGNLKGLKAVLND